MASISQWHLTFIFLCTLKHQYRWICFATRYNQVIYSRSHFVWIRIWVIASNVYAHTFYILKSLGSVSLATLENIDNIDLCYTTYRQNLWSGKQDPRVERFDITIICVEALMLQIHHTYCRPLSISNSFLVGDKLCFYWEFYIYYPDSYMSWYIQHNLFLGKWI